MRTFILILFFSIITLPMLWNIGSAAGLELHGCSKTTCKQNKVSSNVSGSVILSQIYALSDSTDCPGACSTVSSPVGNVHIVGNYMDLACRAWGGYYCRYVGEKK